MTETDNVGDRIRQLTIAITQWIKSYPTAKSTTHDAIKCMIEHHMTALDRDNKFATEMSLYEERAKQERLHDAWTNSASALPLRSLDMVGTTAPADAPIPPPSTTTPIEELPSDRTRFRKMIKAYEIANQLPLMIIHSVFGIHDSVIRDDIRVGESPYAKGGYISINWKDDGSFAGFSGLTSNK